MDNISVIIPARGGSLRIPGKNMIDWRGKPLILWSIEYAQREGFQPIVISDCNEIAAYSHRCGATVLDEPAELAAPEVKIISVAQWAAEKLQTHLILLQCTSPIRRPGLIKEAVEKLKHSDSVYAGAQLPSEFVVDKTGHIINRALSSNGTPPFSQELKDDPQWLLTGALFAMRYPHVMDQSNCLFGDVDVLEVDWKDTVDIDWPEDIERPSVVVVGNASNLKDRKIGWLIDDHDVVVRSNFYRTEGFEESVGSRTTHWSIVCIGGAIDILDESGPRDCSAYTEVWPRYSGDESLYEETCKRLQNVKNTQKICGHFILKNFDRYNTDRQRVECLTTGVVTIANAVDRWGPPVHVAGFGSADKFVSGYYYDKDQAFKKYHDYEAERLLLNEWEEGGYIRRIDQ